LTIDLLHKIIKVRYKLLGFSANYTEFQECKLYWINRYCDKSDKQILFIHGLGTSSSSWVRIIPLLRVPTSIKCIDLPGHGFSKLSNHGNRFTFEQLYTIVRKFILRNQSSPVTLVGHSLGGWIALKIACEHPNAVERLVLINNAGIMCPGIEKLAETFNIKSLIDTYRLLHRMWFRYPSYFEPFTPFVYNYLLRKNINQLINSIRPSDFLNDTLDHLTMPVDIIWGENDILIPKESIEIMKNKIPSATLHLIKECGHVPQLEQPKRLADLLNDILYTPGKI